MYYIVKWLFVQKTEIILWVSYDYPMGILWYDHNFNPKAGIVRVYEGAISSHPQNNLRV